MTTLASCETSELLWGVNTFSNDSENGGMLVNIASDAFPSSYQVTTASDMDILTTEFVLDGLNCYTIDPMTFERDYTPISDPLWYRFSVVLDETEIILPNPQPVITFQDNDLFPSGMKLKYKIDGTWKYDGYIKNLFKWVPELVLPVGAKFDDGNKAGGNYFVYYNKGGQFYRFSWKLVVDIYKSEQDFLDASPGVLSGDLGDFVEARVFTTRAEYDQYIIDNPIADENDVITFEENENQQSLAIVKSPNTFRDFFLQTYPEERKDTELAFGISKLEDFDTQIIDGESVSKYFLINGERVTGKDYLQYLLDNGYVRRFT